MADLWPGNVTDLVIYEGCSGILLLVLIVAEGSLDAIGTLLQ